MQLFGTILYLFGDKMTELKPCPFCGQIPEGPWETDNSYVLEYGFRCCGIFMFKTDAEDKASSIWNTRAAPPIDIDRLAEETADKLMLVGNSARSIIKTALLKAQGRTE